MPISLLPIRSLTLIVLYLCMFAGPLQAAPAPTDEQTSNTSTTDATAVQALQRYPPKGRFGVERGASLATPDGDHFFYAGILSPVVATAFSVDLTQNKPHVADGDFHSLAELAVTNQDDVVEVGWSVDRLLNGDDEPHLFVFHWVDGQPTCYNGCGFVQTPAAYQAGMTLEANGFSNMFSIEHRDGKWNVGYAGEWFGYFPDALWSGRFMESKVVQTFGEVASSSLTPSSEMGSGFFPSEPGAAQMSQLTTNAATQNESFTNTTNPDWYAINPVSSSTFAFGGPGASAEFSISNGITGNWYSPLQSGHGFSIEVIDATLLAEWFTFDSAGRPVWIIGIGPIAGDTAVLDAYVTTGGAFPPNFDQTKVQRARWGSLTLSFASCHNATASWRPVLPGYSDGSMPLSRLTMPSGLTCH